MKAPILVLRGQGSSWVDNAAYCHWAELILLEGGALVYTPTAYRFLHCSTVAVLCLCCVHPPPPPLQRPLPSHTGPGHLPAPATFLPDMPLQPMPSCCLIFGQLVCPCTTCSVPFYPCGTLPWTACYTHHILPPPSHHPPHACNLLIWFVDTTPHPLFYLTLPPHTTCLALYYYLDMP